MTTSSDPSGPEFRRSERIADDRPAWLMVGGRSEQVEVMDISREGARFLATRPASVGKSVQYQVGYGTSAVTETGEVVRCDATPFGQYEIAVCHDLSDADIAFRLKTRVA